MHVHYTPYSSASTLNNIMASKYTAQRIIYVDTEK